MDRGAGRSQAGALFILHIVFGPPVHHASPSGKGMSHVNLPAAAEPRISIASGETRGMRAINMILQNSLRDRAGKLISPSDGFEVALPGRNVTRYEIHCGDMAGSPSGLGVRCLAPQHHRSPAIHVMGGEEPIFDPGAAAGLAALAHALPQAI